MIKRSELQQCLTDFQIALDSNQLEDENTQEMLQSIIEDLETLLVSPERKDSDPDLILTLWSNIVSSVLLAIDIEQFVPEVFYRFQALIIRELEIDFVN